MIKTTAMVHTNTVTITQKEYDSLIKDSEILQALYAGGVDNWEWYDQSLKDFYGDDE